MDRTVVNAPDAPQTPGTYAQAVSIKGVSELLFVGGQIPTGTDGAAPADPLAQARSIWANVDAQLKAAGMSPDDLVKVTVFLSDRRHVAAYRTARDEYLGGRQVSLTCIVTGIFDEAWVMEIEAVAAR